MRAWGSLRAARQPPPRAISARPPCRNEARPSGKESYVFVQGLNPGERGRPPSLHPDRRQESRRPCAAAFIRPP